MQKSIVKHEKWKEYINTTTKNKTEIDSSCHKKQHK